MRRWTPSTLCLSRVGAWGSRGLLALSLGLSLAGAATAQSYTPSPRLDPDRVNVLAGEDAVRPEALRRRNTQTPSHLKQEIINWTRADQSLSWTVRVDRPTDYAISVLMNHVGGDNVVVTVEADGQRLSSPYRQDPQGGASRSPVDGVLSLSTGDHRVTLRLAPRTPGAFFQVEAFSVELVRPEVQDRLAAGALAQRVDAGWMREAGYGLMVHWTSRTSPLSGPRKPYAEAVTDFDVQAFADQVASTGAGFLVFTTSHADQYIPGPNAALDRILPGRTTERDLIADLASALAERDIKLVLYYHLGPVEDGSWTSATGFWDTDSTRFFQNWTDIVGEIGARYGDRVAGFWFDDGIFNYYYRSPDWEILSQAARRGYPGRAICFNSWSQSSATAFQDFHCGEELVRGGYNETLNRDGSFNGTLVRGGDGRITDGSFKGLQATSTFVIDRDWVHTAENAPPLPPFRSAEDLQLIYDDMRAYGATPIINVLIFQDGRINPASLTVMQHFRERVRPEAQP